MSRPRVSKPVPVGLALVASCALATSSARAQPATVDLASARCRVSDAAPSNAALRHSPAAAFSPDGSVFALTSADAVSLTLYDAATCARRASTVVASEVPPSARVLDVLIASPGLILLSAQGALSRWTGRDGEPVAPLTLDRGECTAWAHGAPGRVYVAFTEHTAPDVDRSRVVAIDDATGRVLARSAWLPVAALSLTYEPTRRALYALSPSGRGWRLATPALRAQALALDLHATQERRRLAPTGDGYLAGGYDTARGRFAPYSMQAAAPDGSLLLVSIATPAELTRWRPGTALPGGGAARIPVDTTHAIALGPGGALVVHHSTQQVVAVHALP